MKYCTKCGNELFDEAVICPKCGCPVENAKLPQTIDRSSGSKTATKVFMIIGCIVSAFFYLIPLAWCIPMTVKTNCTTMVFEKFCITTRTKQ